MDRKLAGLFAPARMIQPPGYSFRVWVLPLSRSRAGRTRLRNGGVSAIIAANRCLLNRSTISCDGWTVSIGAFIWWMKYPTQFKPASVAPICTLFISTMRRAG